MDDVERGKILPLMAFGTPTCSYSLYRLPPPKIVGGGFKLFENYCSRQYLYSLDADSDIKETTVNLKKSNLILKHFLF
jgi:hypothetical protein